MFYGEKYNFQYLLIKKMAHPLIIIFHSPGKKIGIITAEASKIKYNFIKTPHFTLKFQFLQVELFKVLPLICLDSVSRAYALLS